MATFQDHGRTAALLMDPATAIDQGETGSCKTALMGVTLKGHASVTRRLLAAGANPHA